MLVQKLNVEDLQFEKGSFDGTMAYAQNKVLLQSFLFSSEQLINCPLINEKP